MRVKRREFITLLGVAATAWPLAAHAQQAERIRRIGVLIPYTESDPDSQTIRTAVEQGLEKAGWTLGRNLAVDYRWNMFNVSQARTGAAELLRLGPDVVLAHGAPTVQALQAATRTVPIVFFFITLAVAQGFVESVAHPGGNITGFSYLEPPIGAKWLQLLKAIAPGVTRVAYVFSPQASPYAGLFYGTIEPVTSIFAVETMMAPVQEPGEFEPVIAALARQPGGGLIIDPDGFTSLHRGLIIELAARYRLPAIYSRRIFARDGGLVVYGVDDVTYFRQLAPYVDRILRGEKPGDLPVQAPTKYELVINLKTAKALGLTVPPSLLASADEVIE